MVVDFDDFYDGNTNLEYLFRLKGVNSRFKCTLFAVPGKLDVHLAAGLPHWIELAVHGWLHTTNRECEQWTSHDISNLLDWVEYTFKGRFAKGFKAPGWQISDDTYPVIETYGYWVADHEKNNNRRPAGVSCYVLGDDSWHGHIQNVCGNGLVETFDELADRVSAVDEFQFVSEVAAPWK